MEGLHGNELKTPVSNEDEQGHPLHQQSRPKAPDQASISDELGVILR